VRTGQNSSCVARSCGATIPDSAFSYDLVSRSSEVAARAPRSANSGRSLTGDLSSSPANNFAFFEQSLFEGCPNETLRTTIKGRVTANRLEKLSFG
jgi:hypothetical protein